MYSRRSKLDSNDNGTRHRLLLETIALNTVLINYLSFVLVQNELQMSVFTVLSLYISVSVEH